MQQNELPSIIVKSKVNKTTKNANNRNITFQDDIEKMN